jgi:drug/metabolite transporter (DMT)-like permease
MTPFLVDAILVLIFSALFAAILFVFSRHRKGQDAAKIHWPGLIGLAVVGGLIVTFVFNLLERRVEKSPDEAGEVLLTKPDSRE